MSEQEHAAQFEADEMSNGQRAQEDLLMCREILAADMVLEPSGAPLPMVSTPIPVGSVASALYGVIQELRAARRAQPVLLGIKAQHAIITPACRANRGDAGAFDEAMRRLKSEYLACQNDANVLANFHLVLTVERRDG